MPALARKYLSEAFILSLMVGIVLLIVGCCDVLFIPKTEHGAKQRKGCKMQDEMAPYYYFLTPLAR